MDQYGVWELQLQEGPTDLDRVLCRLSHVLTPDDAREIRSAGSPVDGQERQRRRLPGDARDCSDHLRPTGREYVRLLKLWLVR